MLRGHSPQSLINFCGSERFKADCIGPEFLTVEFDEDCSDTLNKQIRNAQLAQFNFILVLGQREMEHGTVNVRTRDNAVRGEITVDALIRKFRRFADEYTKDTESAEEYASEV